MDKSEIVTMETTHIDTLKMRPKGSWLPSVNLSTLLTTIRILMAEPNADDGLMLEIVSTIIGRNNSCFSNLLNRLTSTSKIFLYSPKKQKSIQESMLLKMNCQDRLPLLR